MLARKTPCIFAAGFAAGAIAIFLVVGFTNFLVDPFQFFRVSPQPRFSNLMQRHQMPGIIRNYAFTGIVVGSSTVINLSAGRFESLSHEGVRNLSFWGGTANEALNVVRLSLRQKKIGTVYWAIDPVLMMSDFRYPDFPGCMYSRAWSLFPYCYLFNASVFIEALTNQFPALGLSRAGWAPDIDTWKTYGAAGFRAGDFGCEIQARLRRARPFDQQLFERMQRRFQSVVVEVIKEHPETQFNLVFPPLYEPEVWLRARDHPEDAPFIDWAERLMMTIPNASVFDFQAATDITGDEKRFRDAIHPFPDISNMEVSWLTSGRFKISSSTIESVSEIRRRSALEGGRLAASYSCGS